MFTRISSAFHNRRLPQLQYLRSLCSESSSSDKPPSSSNLPTDSKSKLTVAEKAESKSVSKPRDRHIIIGPDNVPYDPSEDPYYTPSLSHYRYPQYFTKDLGNKRTWRAIKNDVELMKKGRIHPTREELPCPSQVDVCIFGGGIIGSAIAYFIKDRAPFSLSVGVIERDPTYTRASTTLSVGGIRQQFSLPENILMSMYGADFLRNAKRNLSILNSEPPDVSFTPQGYLTLADASQAEELIANHKLQVELGALVELYDAERIKEKFPMINTDGIVLGSYGVQNEGWFDPWALLLSLKAKAMCLGAEYIHGDVLDFNFEFPVNPHGAIQSERTTCHHVVIREPDGNTRQVQFAFGVICAGYNSPFIGKKLGYGENFATGIKFPIEPRKRYVYAFNAKDGPGLNFPFLIENSMYCRREGLGGNFICGDSPSEDDEPDVDNLDVDYSFFENHISPKLANRVSSLKNVKLKGAWAGFYDYNCYDQSPIIGRDPFFDNIIWATGFGGQGIQMAPAVGRAVMEIVVDNRYKTIDLSRFGWDRIRQNKPLVEAYSY